jgi:bifunctional DNA-binding transcriptional regulator/antitoxin component of YhaV-PrlF toxin-antitoxin module
MEHAIVTVKGQMVISAALRKKNKINAGTVIHFQEEDGLKRIPVTPQTIDDSVGFPQNSWKVIKGSDGRVNART